jgi:P pilus assembly protein, pilin FimA
VQVFKMMKYFLMVAVLLIAAGGVPKGYAKCTFTGGDSDDGRAIVTMQMPAVIYVDPEVQVGTIIYEDNVESGDITLSCDSQSVQVRQGYVSLTNADAREYAAPGVYATNVAGIGIRVAASSERFPVYTEEDLVRPWEYSGEIRSTTKTTARFRGAAQLVVTGPVASGMLDTSRLISLMTLDNSVLAELRFSPTSVQITTNTCNLVNRNIYVPLKTINAQDFDGQYSEILTDSDFKIEITDCKAGTKIDYQFTSSGSTGVTDGNILNIESGDSAASGVGIQILDQNNSVLQFDQDYTAINSTADKEPVEIPLKARYIKTGEVSGGKVDSVATFELFYR